MSVTTDAVTVDEATVMRQQRQMDFMAMRMADMLNTLNFYANGSNYPTAVSEDAGERARCAIHKHTINVNPRAKTTAPVLETGAKKPCGGCGKKGTAP